MALAILGGDPAFPGELHVGRPNLPDTGRFLARAAEILDRRWLTNDGPVVRELEARVAEHAGTAHAVAVSNATLGLSLLGGVLDLRGDVIVPAWTFVATAHAFRWLGATPRFADVDPRTHTLDPVAVARSMSARTSAIVGVHLWGNAADHAALGAIGLPAGVPVLYDAAHAFGAAALDGRPIGTVGTAAVFSFHATKMIHAFEGGAIVTNDDDLAAQLRLARNFGFVGVDQVAALGINAKMSEIHAAMGLCMLEELPRLSAVNRVHWSRYERRLSALPGVRVVPSARRTRPYVVLEIDPQVAPLTRDEVVEVLAYEGVRARRYFHPGVHRMQPYDDEQPHVGASLPVTERLAESVVALPTGTALSQADVDTICDRLEAAWELAPAVRAHTTSRTPIAV